MTDRKSNFELFRIICIVLIMLSHYFQFENINSMQMSISLASIFVFGRWGGVGVCGFFMISAWFLIDKDFKIQHVLKILFEVFFYVVLSLIIFYMIVTKESVDWEYVIKLLGAPFLGTWWFITAYLFLYLLSPFLSKMISVLHQKIYTNFIIFFTLLVLYANCWDRYVISDLLYAVYVYTVTNYIKRFNPKILDKHYKIITILGFTFLILIQILSAVLKHNIIGAYFVRRYSPFSLVCAMGLFYIFKNVNIRTSRLINSVASTSLGVYMLHENAVYRTWLHESVFKFTDYLNSWKLSPYIFISVIISLIIMAIIDLIRQMMEKPFFKLINIIFKKQFIKLNNWYNNKE